MAVRREDRRVQRTRQALVAALVSLVKEKGFEAVSVQEIIDRANVGRATFYAHFDNKEDLLVGGLEAFRQVVRDLQRRLHEEGGNSERGAFLFAREVFDHALAHRDVFRAMVGRHSGAVVQRTFQKVLVELVRDELRFLARQGRAAPEPIEATVQYVSSGLWGLLAWWLDAKPRPSVDEMDAAFRRLSMAVVGGR